MLVPGRNQSDALSIRPVLDRQQGMVALQGDYQLLAPRQMYIYVCKCHTYICNFYSDVTDWYYGKLMKWIGHDSTPLMPIPGRNQPDALWVRPLPGRYLFIPQWHCRETTTYWVLVNRYRWYRYTDTVLFMEKTWNGMVLVPGSNPLI